MLTRIIHTRFWKDNYVCSLNHKEKLLFIYLLTNDLVNICGIYELPDKYIQADLDLTKNEVSLIKTKLQKDKRFFFYNGWVKVPNIEKYNNYLGEKNIKAKEKQLLMAPKILIGESIDTSINTSIDTLNNHKSEINNNKSIIINNTYSKKEDITDDILQEISEKYNIPPAFVRSKFDDMINWCAAKGKKYNNYKAALMNWVKKDALQIITKKNERADKYGVTVIQNN